MRFFVEVRRRGVLKVATGYLVVSWLALEIGHTLFNVFDLPHAGLQFVFALLALGLPVALLGAWQGWFGAEAQAAKLALAPAGGAAPEGAQAAASHGQANHDEQSHHAAGHHEGPWLAAVFAAVALFAVAVAIGVRFFGMDHAAPRQAPAVSEPPAKTASADSAGFAPPAHSVAVLPFVNLSGDPKQDYFSDGLSEELLNSLAAIRDLQVAARTSSFFFKGKEPKILEVARELNVGAVLEGSVRKDGGHVRITAQLVNALTGYELWSHAYDRDLRNILALQIEIASAVTRALQATLLPDAVAAVELGGTQNPQAFDAFLRGERLQLRITDREPLLAKISAYDEAIRQDPGFAKAYVGRSLALSDFAGYVASASEVHDYFVQARAAAEKAVALAPDLGRAHSALGRVLDNGFFDFARGLAEQQRALALSPGDSMVLVFAVRPLETAGRSESAQQIAQRAVALDPLNPGTHLALGFALYLGRHYEKAAAAFTRALDIDPNISNATAYRGLSRLWLGDLDAARSSCATAPLSVHNHVCLAIVEQRQGRLPEARAELAKIRETVGDAAAFQLAEIHAQWGDVPGALQWLETAYRVRDPGLQALRSDPALAPLRQEARYRQLEQALHFPD